MIQLRISSPYIAGGAVYVEAEEYADAERLAMAGHIEAVLRWEGYDK